MLMAIAESNAWFVYIYGEPSDGVRLFAIPDGQTGGSIYGCSEEPGGSVVESLRFRPEGGEPGEPIEGGTLYVNSSYGQYYVDRIHAISGQESVTFSVPTFSSIDEALEHFDELGVRTVTVPIYWNSDTYGVYETSLEIKVNI